MSRVKSIFDKKYNPQTNNFVSKLDIDPVELDHIIPKELQRQKPLELPDIPENVIVRHFVALSEQNYSVDSGIYPLGSCTMKYNPRINEKIARLEGFAQAHPLQQICEGSMELLYKLSQSLCEICGMDAFTLTPAAGAQGELTGILLFKKYFET